MSQNVNSGWVQWVVLGQTGEPANTAAPAIPQAGGAPVAAQPATPVGQPVAGGNGALGTPGGQAQPSSPLGGSFMFLILAMVLIMLFTSIMAGRKDKKKRAELMNSLKKHDKVQMIGGIIGTIVEMSEHEVVLRVEEGRIRFHKSSVQGILESRGKADGSIAEVKSEPATTAV
jgi:preprotein translocase subunit YajC